MNTTAATAANLLNRWVEYNGSLAEFAGYSFRVDGVVDGRLVLAGRGDLLTLEGVRPASVRVIA